MGVILHAQIEWENTESLEKRVSNGGHHESATQNSIVNKQKRG